MNGDVMTGQEGIRQQSDQRKQAQQKRCGTGNRLVRPLTLRFDAQMLTNMAKGRFHLPAAYEESQDLVRTERQVGRQQHLRVEFIGDIADKDKPKVNAGQTKMEPKGGASGNVQFMRSMVVPRQG